MRHISLTIEMENAAFEGADQWPEVARILRETAKRLEETGDHSGRLSDINGNKVGTVSICDE